MWTKVLPCVCVVWLRRVVWAAAAGAVVAEAPRAALVQDQSSQAFRASVELTVAEIAVRSPDGRLITNLRQDDFRLQEDGAPLEIASFSIDRQPVTAAVMVQTIGDLAYHRQIAAAFVDAISDGDRLTVGSYSAEVAVSPHLTADRAILKRVLSEEMWFGADNRVATGVFRAVTALPAGARRPAVIAIGTSGEGGCPAARGCVDRATALGEARTRHTQVYAVVTGTATADWRDLWKSAVSGGSGSHEGDLRWLARNANGGFMEVKQRTGSSWSSNAADVLEQLRVRYLVGFRPRVAGALRRVTIQVSLPGSTALMIGTRMGGD